MLITYPKLFDNIVQNNRNLPAAKRTFALAPMPPRVQVHFGPTGQLVRLGLFRQACVRVDARLDATSSAT